MIYSFCSHAYGKAYLDGFTSDSVTLIFKARSHIPTRLSALLQTRWSWTVQSHLNCQGVSHTTTRLLETTGVTYMGTIGSLILNISSFTIRRISRTTDSNCCCDSRSHTPTDNNPTQLLSRVGIWDRAFSVGKISCFIWSLHYLLIQLCCLFTLNDHE